LKIRVHLLIDGRVQGVWFRASTQDEAIALGLKGWVKNLYDGRVEVLAEGDEEKVNAFIAWCHKGPPGARVERVEVKKEEFKGEFKAFNITR